MQKFSKINRNLVNIVGRNNFWLRSNGSTRPLLVPLMQVHVRNFHQKGIQWQKSGLSRKPIGVTDSTNRKEKRFENIEFMAPMSIALFIVVGGLSYYLFEQQKKKMSAKHDKEARKGYGTPRIGGEPFQLVDHNGKPFTEKDLLGKFSIVYFGFSHCPDICPDELDKLGCWLDELEKDKISLQPIFVTCDPARDSPEVLKEYLTDFHDGIIGLTGSYDDIKQMCKQYRVYFSTPENVKPGQEYLVDHSIFFYLMDPNAKFMTILGRNLDEVTGFEKIKETLKEWNEDS